nr:Tyramine beta-hydroxylase [Haemonchus contortus]
MVFRETGIGFIKRFAYVPWSARNVLSLKELYSTAPLNINCYGKDGALFPNHPRNWTAVPQPRVFVSPSKKHKDRMECAALND